MIDKILFDDAIRQAAPTFEVLTVEADIVNAPTDDGLWQEIEQAITDVSARYRLEDIRHRNAIDATRMAYKRLGKEPNRYRPSAEALTRRAVKGLGLYRTLVAIDLVNLVSLLTGYSIGGFDADRIEGDILTLGVGRHGEPYQAIGRGELNIEGLPVYRDAVGGIGTPTSDNERTKLTEQTSRLLLTINIYGESEMPREEMTALVARLLKKYAGSQQVTSRLWRIE